MIWPWRRRTRSTCDEARAQMAKLNDRDDEVTEMGRRLRDTQRHNNFSGMVDYAISRAAQTGR